MNAALLRVLLAYSLKYCYSENRFEKISFDYYKEISKEYLEVNGYNYDCFNFFLKTMEKISNESGRN